MSNVLPKETLQAEWNRFRNRLVLVGALVLLGTAILSGLALLPAHAALLVEKAIATQQNNQERGALSEENQQALSERNGIVRAQVLLDSVGPIVSATSSLSEIINATLAVRPSGIRVDHITFVSGASGMMTIDGISRGRESINQYKEALSKSGRFKNISVPVGALVGADGGRFTMTLSGIL